MTMQHMPFGRSISFISVAVMALWVGQAQAGVDYGNTFGVASPGVVDAQAGLKWIKASSLAEGEALGYRAATSDEFQGLLTHKGWEPTDGSFRYPGNPASVGFTADASLTSSSPAVYTTNYQDVSAAWLDGGSGGLVGAMFHTHHYQYLPSCTGGRMPTCYNPQYDSNEAVIGTLSDLQAGAYDSATHTTGSNWSALMNQLPQTEGSTSLMYYMVAAVVPEPSSYALMGLGLIGVAAATRRQRRA